MPALALTVRGMVAAVLFVAAAGKLRGRTRFGEFQDWLRSLPLPGARVPGAAAFTVAVEVAIGLGMFFNRLAFPSLLASAALFLLFAGGTALILRRGGEVECRCFGATGSRLGPIHLVRDGLLCAGSLAGMLASDARGGAVTGLPASLAYVFLGLVLASILISLDNLTAVLRGVPGETVH